MPPPAHQGSKAALITWTVVATVFGVTMLVLSLIAFAGQSDAERQLETLQNQYREVVAAGDLTSPRLTELRDQARQEQRPNLVNFLIEQNEDLAGAAAGTRDATAARQSIDQRLRALATAGNNPVQATHMVAAVNQMQQQLAQAAREAEQAQQQLEQTRADLENQRQLTARQVEAKDEQIRAAQQQLAQVTASTEEYREQATQTRANIEQSFAQFTGTVADNLQDAEDRIAGLQSENSQLRRDLELLSRRFRAGRVRDDQMITNPDGEVIRGVQENIVQVNLGRNNGVTRGLTFEVYDRVRGIPSVDRDSDELPQGKASIEVIRVYPNTAEARVIRTTRGQSISEGDIIANLAFDRNVQMRFRVYGEFDLANAGTPTARDRERLESLVQEFGGQVVPNVTVETDVLVLGAEPEVPQFTDEDLRDPARAQQFFAAQQRRQAYDDVLRRARELNIPILNQNQFLYYIGYFEMAAR